jgi:hypothetical protein
MAVRITELHAVSWQPQNDMNKISETETCGSTWGLLVGTSREWRDGGGECAELWRSSRMEEIAWACLKV